MSGDPMLDGITLILRNEGADNEQGWHSWRCFDKDRYPEPCTCTQDVAAEIVTLVAAEIAAAREDERGKALGVGRWADGADGVARWHHAGSTTQTSAPEAASLLSAAPVPPTSVAPAGEDYGALRWVTEADYDSAIESAREQGQRDEREACIAAVTPWLPHSSDCNIRHYEGVCDCECAPIVAAIRAREEKS